MTSYTNARPGACLMVGLTLGTTSGGSATRRRRP